MKRLLQGAEVWRDGGFVRADVLVDGDRIAAVGLGLPAEGCEVVPLGGMKILPGLVDVHVHLREPGFTAKETIAGRRGAASWSISTRWHPTSSASRTTAAACRRRRSCAKRCAG